VLVSLVVQASATVGPVACAIPAPRLRVHDHEPCTRRDPLQHGILSGLLLLHSRHLGAFGSRDQPQILVKTGRAA